eukprot:g73980.t1
MPTIGEIPVARNSICPSCSNYIENPYDERCPNCDAAPMPRWKQHPYLTSQGFRRPTSSLNLGGKERVWSLNVPTSSCHMLTSCQQTEATDACYRFFSGWECKLRRPGPLKEGEMAPCAFNHAVGDSALVLPRGRDRTSHASYSEKK